MYGMVRLYSKRFGGRFVGSMALDLLVDQEERPEGLYGALGEEGEGVEGPEV